MYKPSLYQISNSIPQIDAAEALRKQQDKITFSNTDTIIDLGSGDGRTTTIVIKKYASKFKQIVGSDVSEAMVKYANKTYGDEKTKFVVFDLGETLPYDMRASFDHAFSVYAIHWVRRQDIAFSNIYNLLKPGGDCFLVFPAYTRLHDFYKIMSRSKKWKAWSVEHLLSPYQDSTEPENEVQVYMEEAGFKNVEVSCTIKHYINRLDLFRTTIEAISPFRIPEELQQDFMEDFMEVVEDMKLVKDEDGETTVRVDYSLIVAYGKKQI